MRWYWRMFWEKDYCFERPLWESIAALLLAPALVGVVAVIVEFA